MIDYAFVKASPALYASTVKFYELVLEPLGDKKIRDVRKIGTGFGDAMPDFWVFANGKDEVQLMLLSEPEVSCLIWFSNTCPFLA
jgi:hypothetical protein